MPAIIAFHELTGLRIAFGGVIFVQSRIIGGAIQTNETFVMLNGKSFRFCEDMCSRPFDAGVGNEIVNIICRNAGFVRPSFIALPENNSPDRQVVSGASERIEIPVFALLPIVGQGIESRYRVTSIALSHAHPSNGRVPHKVRRYLLYPFFPQARIYNLSCRKCFCNVQSNFLSCSHFERWSATSTLFRSDIGKWVLPFRPISGR